MFLYGIGIWMNTRGHIAESRSLLGVGIAINTLTILAGRWMLQGHITQSDTMMVSSIATLSDFTALFFLILNVVL